MNSWEKEPGLDEEESNSGYINPPSRREQMKTVIYGSKSNNEGMLNILVTGINGIREIGEQCIAMMVKDFK